MKNLRLVFCLLFILFFAFEAISNTPVIFSEKEQNNYIGKHVWLLEDTSCKMGINDVKNSDKFELSTQDVPRFGFTTAAIWVKFQVQNTLERKHLMLELNAPLIDEVELFTLNEDGSFSSVAVGQNKPFYTRKYDNPNYLFDLYIDKGDLKTYFIRIKSYDQIEIPLKVTSTIHNFSSVTTDNFMLGIYCGIMLIMIFYNLFIYISIRDRSYLYYVAYILSVMLTQTTFQGYTFKYLWPNCPKFEVQSILLLSILVGYASVEFLRVFLNTKKNTPKLDKVFKVAYVLYFIATILVVMNWYQVSWVLILCIVSPLSMYMLFVGIRIAGMGYRPAKFFSVAWSIFLVGVFIYAMKDFGILPFNNFTVYTMPVGSAVETVLLSFALADRINALKKEKEESQTVMVLALQENEKLIKEQNVMLEQKVNERTVELKETNNQLSVTLANLKDAQMQLISAEKMASLGQLTAGIAHEINNPINFVSANLKPLKMDVDDIIKLVKKYEEIKPDGTLTSKLNEIDLFKKEIDLDYIEKEIEMLISGIEDGAKRTTEIVSGLKTFSRLDESEVKEVNINDGIESTLTLLKYSIPKDIEVTKDLGDLPLIECLPGKLNQVFMNVISNAIYAIGQRKSDEKHKLIIKSYVQGEHVYVSFEDTGIGMTQETRDKIFEPFFTTKDVGEGTGLGMSIVFKIIETHHGKIEIDSEYGKGTKIVLVLNKKIGV